MDILEFTRKISNKLTVDDYKYLRTNGVIELLKGYGFPKKELDDISKETIDKILDIIYHI